jgi:hypothetical protein
MHFRAICTMIEICRVCILLGGCCVPWQLCKSSELEGYAPPYVLQDAKDGEDVKEPTAEEGPWLFSLDFPSYMPVQQHCKNRCSSQLKQSLLSVLDILLALRARLTAPHAYLYTAVLACMSQPQIFPSNPA